MNRKSRGAFLKTIIGILDAHRVHDFNREKKGKRRYFNASSRKSESMQLMHPNASLALPPPPLRQSLFILVRMLIAGISLTTSACARYANSSLYSRINGPKWALRGGRVGLWYAGIP